MGASAIHCQYNAPIFSLIAVFTISYAPPQTPQRSPDIGVNPARDAGDVSPPIFWLVGTSMGMAPPIFGVAM